MAEFTLSQVEDNKYAFSGDIAHVLSNRRAKMALSSLKYERGETCLYVFSDLPINELAKKLKLVCHFTGDSVRFVGEVDSAINKFNEEERDFETFSHKAYTIKENQCDRSDLKAFANSLALNMGNRTLYPLQLLSAYHLAFSQNACNFSVPGAGKTSIVYGAYTYLRNLPASDEKSIEKILIISPLAAFSPWENEYQDCFGKKADSKRISGALSIDSRREYFYGKTSEVTLINYDSVASLRDAIIYFLSNNKVMLVLDEAHKIKNTQGGVRASNVMSLAKFAKSRVVLTGTPAPNGYEDLFNLFHFIWPNRDVIKYSVGQLKDMSSGGNKDGVNRMIHNIDPFFIRIRKSDLGLKPAIENPPIFVPMSSEQEKVYRFIEAKFVSDVSDKIRDVHSELVKARMIRLMQAATNPDLLRVPLSEFSDDETDFSSVSKEDEILMNEVVNQYDELIPPKFIKCYELVDEIVNQRKEKVIIWANFIGNIHLLQKYLSHKDIHSELLYGATPIAQDGMDEESENYVTTREGIIKRFHQPDSGLNVIIANPFAVAESISLHKVCHNAIYLERSFNCTHYLQSKDRIHRYGMPVGVDTNYYFILSQDTVDGVIFDRLVAKESRMNEIIENSPIPLFINATEEAAADIKSILADYARRKVQQI